MSTILISFEPYWFDFLEKGIKKFEYRKHFPKDKVTAYFYVSNPVKAITGIAEFDYRQNLSDWKNIYKDRPNTVQKRIDEFLMDCTYAVPVLKFQPTNKISLNTLRTEVPSFVVPRMYYYIDNTELLTYLNKNLKPSCQALHHSFEIMDDDDIC